MRKKNPKKKRPKISKKEREWKRNMQWVYDRNDFLEKLLLDKENQISYFMKFLDNKMDVVLSGKSENS